MEISSFLGGMNCVDGWMDGWMDRFSSNLLKVKKYVR